MICNSYKSNLIILQNRLENLEERNRETNKCHEFGKWDVWCVATQNVLDYVLWFFVWIGSLTVFALHRSYYCVALAIKRATSSPSTSHYYNVREMLFFGMCMSERLYSQSFTLKNGQQISARVVYSKRISQPHPLVVEIVFWNLFFSR